MRNQTRVDGNCKLAFLEVAVDGILSGVLENVSDDSCAEH